MRATGSRRWLEQHYVVLTEIGGYAMAVVVGTFVVYSLFVTVEIVVPASGTLHPPFVDVSADAEAIPIEYVVLSDQEVTAGQPVCRVVLDASAQHRLLTRWKLESAIAMLEADPDTQPATLETVRNVLATLPSTEDSAVLEAPGGGWLKHTAAPDEGILIPPGQAIARIYDLKQLVLEAAVASSNTDHTISVGMKVRMTLEDFPEPILGNVAAVADSENGQEKVTVLFEGIPADCQNHFHALVFSQDKDNLPSVDAKIIVGRRSFFKELFGRN